MIEPPRPRCGEYVKTLSRDSDAERNEGRRIMRAQGCKSVRFESLDDGRMNVHGYLAAGVVGGQSL